MNPQPAPRDEVLVVDDDADGRETMAALLDEVGYEVRAVGSGEDCLVEVERREPSLVLLDVSMPGLDGIETLRRLRDRHGALPVVLLTGERIDPDSIGAGLETGATEYLTKPIHPRELKARVHALVEQAKARRASDALLLEQTAMLVHDLRQPLAVVSLHGENLSDGDGDAERRAGNAIRAACHQMSYLINAVLTMVRRRAHGFTLERRRCAVEPIVDDVAAQLRPLAEKRAITVEVDAPGHTHADVDEFRIIQVLHNLLGNALKFTPRGGRIRVTCHRAQAALVLSVDDTGPGLSPEDARRIFERWVQTEAGRARGGTGLGLAIARDIVEAHGGAITCESRPGAGARFQFTLPIVDGERRLEEPRGTALA